MSAAEFVHDPEVFRPGLGGMGISMPSITLPRIDFDVTKSPAWRELQNLGQGITSVLPPEVLNFISLGKNVAKGGGPELLLRAMVCRDWSFVATMVTYNTYSTKTAVPQMVSGLVDAVARVVGVSDADRRRIVTCVEKAMTQGVCAVNGMLMGIATNSLGVFENGGAALNSLFHGRYGEFGHFAGAMNRDAIQLFVKVGAAVLAPVTGGASLAVCAAYVAMDSLGIVPGYFSTRDRDQRWYQGVVQAALVMLPQLGQFGAALGYVPNAGMSSAISAMSAAFPSVAAAVAAAVSTVAKYALAAATYLGEMTAALPTVQAIGNIMAPLGISWDKVVVAIVRRDYMAVLIDSGLGVGRISGIPVDEAAEFLAKAEGSVRNFKDIRSITGVMSSDLAARGARYLAPDLPEDVRTVAAAGDYRSASKMMARSNSVPALDALAAASGADPDQVERLLAGDRSAATNAVQQAVAERASTIRQQADQAARAALGDEQFEALRTYGNAVAEATAKAATARLAEAVAIDRVVDLAVLARSGNSPAAAALNEDGKRVAVPTENPAIYAAKWSTARAKTVAVVMRERVASFAQSRQVDVTTALVKARAKKEIEYSKVRALAVDQAGVNASAYLQATQQQYQQAVASANARVESARAWASSQQSAGNTATAALLSAARAAVMTKAQADVAGLDQMSGRLALLAARLG